MGWSFGTNIKQEKFIFAFGEEERIILNCLKEVRGKALG
jgi:hypothetical protein